MKLIIEVTEGYYKHLKDKKHNRKATVSDATILDGIPYEERLHGEWVEGYHDCFETLDCSLCGYVRDNRYATFNFCPNCGADMRKESENE